MLSGVLQRVRVQHARQWAIWAQERPEAIASLLRQHSEPAQLIERLRAGGLSDEAIRQLQEGDTDA